MRFQVLEHNRPRPVRLEFGGARELGFISHWRTPSAVAERPAVRDTSEFARLAAKRHRHYIRTIPAASSIANFQAIIAEQPLAEVALFLLVRGNWFRRSPILGLAQCRPPTATIWSLNSSPFTQQSWVASNRKCLA